MKQMVESPWRGLFSVVSKGNVVNPANGTGVTDIQIDDDCVKNNPCTHALFDRLNTLDDHNKKGVTGNLGFDDSQDRKEWTYALMNWQGTQIWRWGVVWWSQAADCVLSGKL